MRRGPGCPCTRTWASDRADAMEEGEVRAGRGGRGARDEGTLLILLVAEIPPIALRHLLSLELKEGPFRSPEDGMEHLGFRVEVHKRDLPCRPRVIILA